MIYSLNRYGIPEPMLFSLADPTPMPETNGPEQQDQDLETTERPPERLTCPKCGSGDVRRAKSEGFMPSLLAMFGRWPFRCRSCRRRFFRYAPPPEDA